MTITVDYQPVVVGKMGSAGLLKNCTVSSSSSGGGGGGGGGRWRMTCWKYIGVYQSSSSSSKK